MKKVLILGVSGMLGSLVFDFLLKNNKYDVRGTVRGLDFPGVQKIKSKLFLFDAEKDNFDENLFLDFKPDYIINCIGIIKPHCKDDNEEGTLRAIKVNALFPHKLALVAKMIDSRVIQIATDCVYNGRKGGYLENGEQDALDVYGKTKSLGEVKKENFINIRCSIIGPELKGGLSLLEWFLKQPEDLSLKGFEHHKWNGVTTLQFAKLCQKIIDKGEKNFDKLVNISKIHHYIPNETVNKFELLNIFKDIFKRKNIIERVNNIGEPIDRTIGTKFYELINKEEIGKIKMRDSIKELKGYMDDKYFK